MSQVPKAANAPHQEFFIPIHGYVRLSPKEVAVVNHPAFQRLRRTRQLGFAHLVFPGGIHTRFEHSLGTVHVAQRMVDHVNLNDQRKGQTDTDRPEPLIGEAHQELIRLAALLHDIGHLPYGHTLEDELGHLAAHDGASRLDKVSTRPFRYYVRPSAAADGSKAGTPATTERHCWTLRELVDHLYAATVSDLGIGEPAYDVVRAIISKPPKDKQECKASEDRRRTLGEKFNLELCRDMVGNTICADFLDYLYRDWHHLGKPLYEDTRIYQYMEARRKCSEDTRTFKDGTPRDLEFVINVGAGEKIRHDALTSILELLEGRYKLAETVLFHRTKLAVTGLLDRCLLELADLYVQAGVGSETLSSELERLLLDASDDSLPELLLRLTNGDGIAAVGVALQADIAESHDAAVEALGDTDDLLSAARSPREGRVESALEGRQRSIGTLVNSLRDRSIYRMLYKLKHSDFPASHGKEKTGPEKVYDMYRPKDKRRGFLEGIERLCGLSEHALVMYCPPTEMNAKVAKVKLLIDDQVIRFDKYDSENQETSLTRGALWAHIARFSELWSTQIFLRQDVWDALNDRPAIAGASAGGPTMLDQLKHVVATFLYRVNGDSDAAIRRMDVESSIRAIRDGVGLPQAARASTADPLAQPYRDFVFPSGLAFACPGDLK